MSEPSKPAPRNDPLTAAFLKGAKVKGPSLEFREALEDDAAFTLALRLDPARNEFLSAVSDDVELQAAWIRSASCDPTQLYFIIETNGRPVGTVRLYDQRRDSFCWGSWILVQDAPKSSAVESTLMVYKLGLSLDFKAAHFEVRKGNIKVWQYHERLGAERISEDDENIYYVMSENSIRLVLNRYATRGPIEVWLPRRERGSLNPAQSHSQLK